MGRGLWERGQLREKWPWKVLFASDPSHWLSIPTSLQGKGSAQQPQKAFPGSHGASDSHMTPWLPHSHYELHTHACHIMNPSGGFGHGECRRGGARPDELWVFPLMDVSWILTPTRITGWSHKTMEWAQLPLASHSTLLRLKKTIINTDAGGHPGSLACFPGVGLLFSAVLQLSWGPSKPCPGQPSCSLGFFNSPSSTEQVFPAQVFFLVLLGKWGAS